MAMVAPARPDTMAKAAAAKPSNAYSRWKKKLDSLDPDSDKYKTHLAAGMLKGYGAKGAVKRKIRLAFAHRTTASAQTLVPGPAPPLLGAPTTFAGAAAAPAPASSQRA